MRIIKSVLAVVSVATVVIATGLWLNATQTRRRHNKPIPDFLTHASLSDIDASCGPVSLSIASRLLKRPGTIEDFARLSSAGYVGQTSLADLKDAADQWGLAAEGVLIPHTVHLPQKTILVLHVYGSHFAVGVPLHDDRILIVDPPKPPIVLTRQELDTFWDGNALLIAKDESDLATSLRDFGSR